MWRRTTKKLLCFFIGIVSIIIYCEFLIYYVVISQCSWPRLETDTTINSNALRIAILADIHLLGPKTGHWVDKMRREWQMHRAFQTIIALKQPEVVFILGDIFDEGQWSNNNQFEDYVDQLFSLFSMPNYIKLYVVVGNHDIGFHNYIKKGAHERFSRLLNTPSVQLISIQGNNFVLINSMAMEGDSCHMCTEARRNINNISDVLECSRNSSKCSGIENKLAYAYSRPILMQHFPLYRLSDAICTEPDSAPLPERNDLFRPKYDALSKESTEYLVKSIRPRVAFGGHTHHGCHLHHRIENDESFEFDEFSIPSFSWRNRLDPKFMLVTVTPEDYSVNKCGLPREITILLTFLVLLSLLIYLIARTRTLGQK